MTALSQNSQPTRRQWLGAAGVSLLGTLAGARAERTSRRGLLPNFDQAYSALIEDLDARGLLDQTLVVTMGEMGRTPKINAKGGRDHWTYCYSVLLAGASLQGGAVHGASDKQAAFIQDQYRLPDPWRRPKIGAAASDSDGADAVNSLWP